MRQITFKKDLECVCESQSLDGHKTNLSVGCYELKHPVLAVLWPEKVGSCCIKTWLDESDAEELDRPAQSLDLDQKPERRSRAKPSRSTSVPDLTNALLARLGTDSHRRTPKSCRKAFEEEWLLLFDAKEVLLQLYACSFSMGCPTTCSVGLCASVVCFWNVKLFNLKRAFYICAEFFEKWIIIFSNFCSQHET